MNGTLRAPRFDGGSAATLLLGAASAAAGVYSLFRGPFLFALAACVLPLVLWLIARPGPALGLLGASIPITYSLTGGHGGFNLSPSDLLLVLVGAAIFFEAVLRRSLPSISALHPLKFAVVQYAAYMVVLLAIHLSANDMAQTAQRFELFLLPLVVGAFAALTGRHIALLKAYVLAAAVLAALWPIAHGLGQKNPVGQMIGDAILVVVAVRALRRFLPCLLVLVPGLALTLSRGAVLATGVGLLVVLAFQDSRASVALRRAAVLVLLAFATYAMLPTALQTRLTTLAPGIKSPGAYALYVRRQYAHDAERIIKAHPWVGIGVGNYLAGSSSLGTQTSDPHDVLLLHAAEGGYAFAASFVVLVAAASLILRRMKHVDVAAAAAGVTLATFAHGLVDVYWVRGTPVLSWLVVGMACGGFAIRRGSTETRTST
jgi:hypothetical protein